MRVSELVPNQINTIILPVGTVEAHGPSCLGTDNFIPECIAEGIADRINALVAPTINYGITKSLYRYRGGSAIKVDTFSTYLLDILSSFAASEFKNIIIMNGHGGNNTALKSLAHQFHTEYKVNIAVIHWWQLCIKLTEEFFGHVGGHGGTDETAMVMAVDPDLVDEKLYKPEQAYLFDPGADVYPVPGTILLYKEGEGYPEFDAARAKEYQGKVIEKVGDFVEMVLKRWQEHGLQ
jgi:creatinine amidohydrolase